MKNNLEIEIKVLEINKKELEKKLQKIGAQKIFSNKKIIQENYNNKDLKKRKTSLRIRQLDKEIYVTYKEFKDTKHNVKNCKEIEFQVSSDFRTIQNLFKLLGLTCYQKIEKQRTSYTLGNITFDIDTITKPVKIPTYFEIEAKDHKTIEKTLQLLGIPKGKVKAWGTKQLLDYYKKLNL
ncbi:MAG TPA: CYTH domain-containing protein [archaeon]|nr:CYTH domain-containing protein [archaeon]